ncbi:MAG: hypothetical protein CME43_07095 [Haliea sp.]|nr:hypothetical protein [Haliea sp.]
MPEVTLGLIPGSLGTQHLPRLVGLKLAAQMISTAKPIDAGRALDAGLVDHLAEQPGEQARSEARRLGFFRAPYTGYPAYYSYHDAGNTGHNALSVGDGAAQCNRR